MKTLIIYTSQTGFTKKYAELLAKQAGADVLTLKEAKKQQTERFEDYDAIVYGGWVMAGSVSGSKWFLQKAAQWKNKRLAIFCVGASPKENPDIEVNLHKLLTDEQRTYIRTFYCQGGIDYERMNGVSKFVMKALANSLRRKKNATEKDRAMAEMISRSYDISDEKYIEPIVKYLRS